MIARKKRGGNIKLTVEAVAAIKHGLKDGIPGRLLATLHRTTESNISHIKHGTRWSEV